MKVFYNKQKTNFYFFDDIQMIRWVKETNQLINDTGIIEKNLVF